MMIFSNLFSKKDIRSDIETILLSDKDAKWKVREDNNNCFTDYRYGRALHVYPDHLKFFDDLRAHSAFATFPIPKSKLEILKIIKMGGTNDDNK